MGVVASLRSQAIADSTRLLQPTRCQLTTAIPIAPTRNLPERSGCIQFPPQAPLGKNPRRFAPPANGAARCSLWSSSLVVWRADRLAQFFATHVQLRTPLPRV